MWFWTYNTGVHPVTKGATVLPRIAAPGDYMEQFAHISHIVIFTGVFKASPEDGTVCLKLSLFRQLCRPLYRYLIDTLLVLVRRTRTVLFCVCKVSLQSFDNMPPKSLLSIIVIIITQCFYSINIYTALHCITCQHQRKTFGVYSQK